MQVLARLHPSRSWPKSTFPSIHFARNRGQRHQRISTPAARGPLRLQTTRRLKTTRPLNTQTHRINCEPRRSKFWLEFLTKPACAISTAWRPTASLGARWLREWRSSFALALQRQSYANHFEALDYGGCSKIECSFECDIQCGISSSASSSD